MLEAISQIEHPEIVATLAQLGMILDVWEQGTTARVAMALPLLGLPEAVRNMRVMSIQNLVEALYLKFEVKFLK